MNRMKNYISGIEGGLKILQYIREIVKQQIFKPDYPAYNPWPGWRWALLNAQESHESASWVDPYDDLPF